MHSSDDSIESLRQQVNAATTTLAAKRMLDKDATRALAWILQHSAARACASLQQRRLVAVRNDQASSNTTISHGSDDDDERVMVLPIQIDDTISRELNPLQFSYPFVVAPYKCGEIAEYHLSATCAVGFFNLALAIHNQVYKMSSSKEEEEEDERKEILRHCKHLYLQVHELLNHLEMDPHGTLIQVFLACSNNLSEVFHQLQDAQAAKEWQYTLCECLCTIPPASTSPVYVHFCNVCRVYNVSVDDEQETEISNSSTL